jgi:hypothetical protein
MPDVEIFQIVRAPVSSSAPTLGELLVKGAHFCSTLELPWLNNLPGKSCIPVGQYQVILSLSTRFKREMPRLIGVPGRVGILFHSGDTQADTEGCVLLGEGTDAASFAASDSRTALRRFMAWFASVGNTATVTIRNKEA